MEIYGGVETAPLEIAALQPVPATIWDDPSSLIAILYLGGLAMVLLRIGAGLLTLRRWTREASPVADSNWLDAMARVRPAGTQVRLLVSNACDAPLSWGWLRPVIMLDRDTLERPEDADAILAHEVAHIERRDWPALMMTRASVALFWFNPLAWLLERELVQQAEEAADSSALARVEPARYAQTLVSCARHSRTVLVPANSMAPRASGLRRRVSAILEGRCAGKSGSFWSVAAMLGCAGFAAPLAAVELVPAMAELVDAPAAPLPPVAVQAAAAAPVEPAAPAALGRFVGTARADSGIATRTAATSRAARSPVRGGRRGARHRRGCAGDPGPRSGNEDEHRRRADRHAGDKRGRTAGAGECAADQGADAAARLTVATRLDRAERGTSARPVCRRSGRAPSRNGGGASRGEARGGGSAP
jgi:beta-lactamase regulating signal transducer with metallopeptidase domain